MTNLRNLPSVEQLLQTRTAAELISQHGRPLVLEAIRSALEKVREGSRKGVDTTLPGRDRLLDSAAVNANQCI